MGYEEQRAERDFRMNPPKDAPMQGSGDDWENMKEGSSSVESSENVADSYKTNINETLSNANPNAQGGTGVDGQAQSWSQKSDEDKFFDGLVFVFKIVWTTAKGIWGFLMLLIKSVRNNTKGDWHRYGVKLVMISSGCVGIGFLGALIKLFTRNDNRPQDLMVGGLISAAVGIFFCMFFDADENAKGEEGIEEGGEVAFEDMESSDGDGDVEYVDEVPFSDEGEYGDEDDTDWGAIAAALDEEEKESSFSVNSEMFKADDVVSSLTEIPAGTWTRQYLFDAFRKVLPIVNPDYSVMKDISPDMNLFYDFENWLREAAGQSGMKEENYPELLSLHENPFIYRLECSRPSGMKDQMIGDEVAKSYSRDPDTLQIVHYGVYSTVETVGSRCLINVFKGYQKDSIGRDVGTVAISLGDVYKTIPDFVSSSEVEFPFVWGINEMGRTMFCDMKDNNSIIISGMPRGGKSWKGQSIVAQLAMFHSPKEVNFYILDNKNDASDYKYPARVLPHVKYFCGDFYKIADSLGSIIEMAEKTNGRIITSSGHINIKDYNKDNPMDKLPYIYVVIDELQALMDFYKENDMKEEAQKFRGYLSTMASKLPYAGLRFVLFPHRIVDQIINKDTYSLVSCRAIVNQLDMKQVSTAVGVSESGFKYKLAQKGDMAIRLNEINGGEACFCHAEMLSNSNKGNEKLFSYIGAVWKKLEPDVECITFSGKIGGKISSGSGSGSSSGSRFNDGPKPARDVTEGKDSYRYTGSDFSLNKVADLVDDEYMEDSDSEDEDFWDSITGSDF